MVLGTIKACMKRIYRIMQQNYVTFRFLIWLEDKGLVEWIMFKMSGVDRDVDGYKQAILNSKFFFDKHIEDVRAVANSLEDKKSKDVYLKCIKYRMHTDKMLSNGCCEGNQYLVNQIIKIDENEVFVDCGAFIGDTIQRFENLMKKKHINNYRVVAFEPSENNAQLIRAYFGQDEKIVLIQKGVGGEKHTQYFRDAGLKSKCVHEKDEASCLIETTTLDDVEECHSATFIKMDIEGSELDALKGAQKIILKNKPKLAICIYHSDEDMIRIPLYIKQLVPSYKLYIRQHSQGRTETVLYAVP